MTLKGGKYKAVVSFLVPAATVWSTTFKANWFALYLATFYPIFTVCIEMQAEFRFVLTRSSRKGEGGLRSEFQMVYGSVDLLLVLA